VSKRLELKPRLLHSVRPVSLGVNLNLTIRSDEGSRRVGNWPHTDEATLVLFEATVLLNRIFP